MTAFCIGLRDIVITPRFVGAFCFYDCLKAECHKSIHGYHTTVNFKTVQSNINHKRS